MVTVRDFTKFRIPPPLSFELEKISRIFPYPGAENLIHLLVFPTYSPGWPGVLPLGEADDMCIIYNFQKNSEVILFVTDNGFLVGDLRTAENFRALLSESGSRNNFNNFINNERSTRTTIDTIHSPSSAREPERLWE